jgi:FKBP-type peptidyl-prolyl cis-trans isomerase
MKLLSGGVALAVALLGFSSCETAQKSGADIATWEDSLSYAIGVDVAKSLKQNGNMTLVPEMLAAGYREGLDSSAVFKEEDLKNIMSKFQNMMRAKAEEERNKEGEANRAKGEAWLATNKSAPGVMTTPSGLQYKVITEGTGKKPTLADQVKAHYAGTLTSGKEFDSSYKRGEPATFPLGGVIRGWQEGLQLMSVGSKYELYIPSDMGYGAQGFPPDIGPNEVLIFQVELLDVMAGASTPPPGGMR